MKNKKKIIIISACIILSAAMCAAVVLFLNRNKPLNFKNINEINSCFKINVPEDAEIIDSAYNEIDSIDKDYFRAVLVKITEKGSDEYIRYLSSNYYTTTEPDELKEEWLDSCYTSTDKDQHIDTDGKSSSVRSDKDKFEEFRRLAESNGLSEDNLTGIYKHFYTEISEDTDLGTCITRDHDTAYVFDINGGTYVIVEGRD